MGATAPLEVKGPFNMSHLRPLENTDVYITINNSKISYEVGIETMVGGHHDMKNCINGLQYQEG